MTLAGNVPQLVDHLFRRQAGQMVSTLTAIFGSRNLDMAEDVVQEALLRALQLWPYQGVPDNPRAWLTQVAKNLALDRLRRETALALLRPELERRLNDTDASETDQQLAMMFLCCHPCLSDQAQMCLTLKLVAGFSVKEIARGLLSTEDAVAQRIVRAKREIREQGFPMEIPTGPDIALRLDSVLNVIYLVFNEGYSASGGENLLREDLCAEAIYLTSLLLENPLSRLPKVHALQALQSLQSARLPARIDNDGDLLLLAEQDRSLWDGKKITEGFHHLAMACDGDEISTYHVQAALAAVHSAAQDLASTDWQEAVHLYDQLMELNPSPIVELNRAVAISKRDGPEAGLQALKLIRDHASLANYYLLYAVLGSFYESLGDVWKSRECFQRALKCPCNAAERRFLERRLGN